LIRLELVETDNQRAVVKRIIENHHSYVPTHRSVGRRIDWLVYHSDYTNILGVEKPIGMIGIGSSVYPCPKDILNHLGKTANEYKEPDHFNTIANNWRFCMTESIKNAGTQILKQVRKQAPIEWKKKYGDDWKQIGETAGLAKERKSFSVKWSSAEFLKETFLPPTGENKKLIFLTGL